MARARYGSMNRGLSGQKTNPIAPAPAAAATCASSARVIPQIFTNIWMGPGSPEGLRYVERSPSTSGGVFLCVLCNLCVLCAAAGCEQLRQLRSRICGSHETLPDQERAVSETPQTHEILR